VNTASVHHTIKHNKNAIDTDVIGKLRIVDEFNRITLQQPNEKLTGRRREMERERLLNI